MQVGGMPLQGTVLQGAVAYKRGPTNIGVRLERIVNNLEWREINARERSELD